MSADPPLSSGVVTSPADGMLTAAIARTLAAPPAQRAALFAQLVAEIEAALRAQPLERPWTCTIYRGVDGAYVFRGGVGHSLVIDPAGRLWRARSHEDFETTYTLANGTCSIATLTPLYAQKREFTPR